MRNKVSGWSVKAEELLKKNIDTKTKVNFTKQYFTYDTMQWSNTNMYSNGS